MNSNDIKMILDKTNINVLDEINILEYIDELEKVKKELLKRLERSTSETIDYYKRINKAIEYIEDYKHEYYYDLVDKKEILNILRGKENE